MSAIAVDFPRRKQVFPEEGSRIAMVLESIDPTSLFSVRFDECPHASAWMEEVANLEPSDISYIAGSIRSNPNSLAKSRGTRRRTRITTYFLQCGMGGPIKVGVAGDVDRRIKSIQCSCPIPLSLLLTQHGDHERIIHGHFRHARIRGEWYWPTPKFLELIALLSEWTSDAHLPTQATLNMTGTR